MVAPTARLSAGRGWRLFLTGSYGQDHTRYDITNVSGGTAVVSAGNCYCNDAVSAELGGDGSLFRLPAGPVKIALGAGYRNNDFVRFNGVGATQNVTASQDSHYAYGELSLPLVSEHQDVRFVHSLSASGAVRYENYPGVGKWRPRRRG